MVSSASLYRRKTFFLVVLLVVFFAFTADVVDLREELRILPCPSASLDNNVSTGVTAPPSFNQELTLTLGAVDAASSIKVSFLHLMPCGLRAPPAWS